MAEEKGLLTSKTKVFLEWFWGIAFLILGLLFLGSNFISGLVVMLAGLLLIPFFFNKISSKIKFLGARWVKVLIIFFATLLLLFSFEREKYSVSIKDGKDDPQIVMDFQKDLVELINNYKEAQIRSLVITQIKFGGAGMDEARKYAKETSKKWEEVREGAEKMDKYIKYQEKEKIEKSSFWKNPLLFPKTFAKEDDYKVEVDLKSKPGEFVGSEKNELSEVELRNKDKNLIQTDWDMVEIRRSALPDKSILKAVRDHFGVSAKKSKELIDQYHGGMADVWKDEENYALFRENLFRSIGAASSVGLTIGGGVVFMGELAAVSAGPTVLSGLKLAAGTSVLAFAKTDAILEVMETGVIVATGDEKNAAAITQFRESTSKINAVVAVKDLIKNPTLNDGGNLFTVYNLGGEVLEKVILFDEKDNKMEIEVKESFTPMSSDGIVKEYFPKEFEYEYLNWGDEYQKNQLKKQEAVQEKKKNYKGDAACWKGSDLSNEQYQHILKFSSKHNADQEECRKELGMSAMPQIFTPEWLLVMRCACDKDPEAAMHHTYCCSDIDLEELKEMLKNDLKRFNNALSN